MNIGHYIGGAGLLILVVIIVTNPAGTNSAVSAISGATSSTIRALQGR